jgi:phospholipase/carboxylesterase
MAVSSPPRAADGRLDSRPTTTPAGPPLPPGTSDLRLSGAEVLVAAPDGAAGGPRPLLVFLHGAGGSAGNALAAVAGPAMARGVVVLAPTSVATTWDLMAGGLGRDVAVLDAALAEVFRRCTVGPVAIGGFSDGGSYALSLGVANGDLAGALLGFSPGFLAAPARHGHPRVWICHGTDDRVLPVQRCGRRVAGDLAAAGYDVTYDEFAGGHVVTPHLVATALDWWLGRPG